MMSKRDQLKEAVKMMPMLNLMGFPVPDLQLIENYVNQEDPHIDVMELCALLQCLGFSVKSLETKDSNVSQEDGVRTVAINCQASGLHVVMERNSGTCSCPDSGIEREKLFEKESGRTLLDILPKEYRERLSEELLEIVEKIRKNNQSKDISPKESKSPTKISASMCSLRTHESRLLRVPSGPRIRNRSLDTLTTAKAGNENLPEPGPLKQHKDRVNRKVMHHKQSTYAPSSTSPGKGRQANKASPIQRPEFDILERLKSAEKAAEDLRKELASIGIDYRAAFGNDIHHSSRNSSFLKIPNIVISEVPETSNALSASAPNLSLMESCGDDISGVNQTEGVKTPSKLKRFTTNLFKLKKDLDKNILKPKTATTSRIRQENPKPSPSSQWKKKYSHVKSTIPKPSVEKK